MIYAKPKILAESTIQMSECRPSSKPSGRPCTPGGIRGANPKNI